MQTGHRLLVALLVFGCGCGNIGKEVHIIDGKIAQCRLFSVDIMSEGVLRRYAWSRYSKDGPGCEVWNTAPYWDIVLRKTDSDEYDFVEAVPKKDK